MLELRKRAFDAVASAVMTSSNPGNEQPEPVNVFAIILFMVTLIFAAAGFILFDYTFQVVKILTIVEDLPSDFDLAPAYDPVDGDSEPEDGAPPHYRDDAENHPESPTVHKIAPGLYLGGSPDVHGKYITSSFRKTLLYLRHEAGFWSAWRGFSVNIIYTVAASCVNGIFLSMFPFPFGRYISGVLVMLVVSPLSLVHTHIIIAPPTKETWFGRLSRLPFRSILHTLPAALLVAVTGQATYAFPDIMVKAFVPSRAFDDPPPQGDNPYQSMLTPLQCLAIYSVFLASHVFLFIPSMIILYRVQASVYASTEEAIIPFERLGPQTILQAWKSYTWEGKKRLIRLYAKIMPLVWLAAFSVGTLLFFEMRWVMGAKGHVLDAILKTWLKNQYGRAA